jgi:hypothetical protein
VWKHANSLLSFSPELVTRDKDTFSVARWLPSSSLSYSERGPPALLIMDSKRGCRVFLLFHTGHPSRFRAQER